jgi:sulfate/thiosulfate transport system ATP-binding protein
MKIRLENVVKTFDTFRAVRDVSLGIESGELLALLGPSGSGKTTILRMVAGLEYSDGGRIFFGDEDATNIPVRDRGVGFVFQHYALFPHMTLHQNIAFGMKVSKVKRDKAAIDARVEELLRLVKLDGLGDRFPAQISGVRFRSTRRCFCSMSPSGRWTPMCAATCAAGCARFTIRSASPRFS